ncbi:MAG: transcription antitermination protein NusB, partial [Gemmatimonadota bacterium]
MRERSKARAWALRVLYAWDARGDAPLEVVLDEFMTRRRIAAGRRSYIRRLLGAVAEDPARLDATVQGCLSNWRLDRLAVIDRNILRLAAAEMLYLDDVPPR